jgi:hypothetical protein
MIRIRFGIKSRISEIAKFENATTRVTPIAITKVGFIEAVTANDEQIPNTCTVTGLSSSNGSVTNFFLLLENKGSEGAETTTSLFSLSSVLIIICSNIKLYLTIGEAEESTT